MIVLFSTEFFYPVQAVDYFNLEDDYALLDSENLDEGFDVAWTCYWLIMCDFGKIMEFKEAVDAAHNKTIIYFVDEAIKLFPELELNKEDAFNEEFWQNELEDLACSLPEDERVKLKTIPILDYSSEICRSTNPEDRAECRKVEEATEICVQVMMKYKDQCLEVMGKEAAEDGGPKTMVG
ncbi:hypothetical protein AVEN_275058-1 [Araneus ventricosus]|uniref:Uncharacterized protein n=1 Tax=Araneus ventricosus TaxID=182803 RepID=A0A4Y2MU42_ARAVE|nr:hypothetical protein AVEN_275058-1 [Araneus ventricosus]